MSRNDICVFNIIANDYIPQQQLFTKYFKKNHPDIDIYCITLENKNFDSKLFKSIPIDKIDTVDNLDFLKFKYNVLELSTAVKPAIFLWLFKKYHYKKILYFDSDILVYRPLNEIIKKLDIFDALVTPHIRENINDNKEPNEIDFVKSGYFNAGFLGLKRSNKSIKFLRWWAEKTNKYCYIDFNKFYFVDQRWLDYLPIFLDAYIIKEPGYNVAYFNLHEYIGKIDTKKIFFIHFSGFDKDKVSVYQRRFDIKSLREYSQYFKNYYSEINDLSNSKSHKYKYDYFNNEVYISPYIKKIFLNSNIVDEYGIEAKTPFNIKGEANVYSFLNNQHRFIPLTNLMYLLYTNNHLLKERFPDLIFLRLNSDLYSYILWFISKSKIEYGIDKAFIDKQKKIMDDIKPITKLYDSFLHKNRLKRLVLRYKYFFQIMAINSKIIFTKNLYLFLLNRNPDEESFKKIKKNHTNIYEFKKILLNDLIKSFEFVSVINSGQKSKTNFSITMVGINYKYIGLFFININKFLNKLKWRNNTTQI
ncbi:MAG: hypothetical protein WC741_04260 [Patescibacteria group bacterium]|jgi:hypothetical protein